MVALKANIPYRFSPKANIPIYPIYLVLRSAMLAAFGFPQKDISGSYGSAGAGSTSAFSYPVQFIFSGKPKAGRGSIRAYDCSDALVFS